MVFDKEKMGQKIKMARKEKGFTQEHLAELVGISNRTLNLMEKGKSGMTIETLIKFCNSLDVSPNYMLSFSHKSNNNRIKDTLEHFTPNQKLIVEEFLSTFKKLSDNLYNNE